MALYFFDTSALVKRYVNEVGTDWVQTLVNPTAGNDIYILRVTEVENDFGLHSTQERRLIVSRNCCSTSRRFPQ